MPKSIYYENKNVSLLTQCKQNGKNGLLHNIQNDSKHFETHAVDAQINI